MVSFTVRMRFGQDDREKVSEILRNLAIASRKEPGVCQLCSASRRWRSGDGADLRTIPRPGGGRGASRFAAFRTICGGWTLSTHERPQYGNAGRRDLIAVL